MSSILKAPTLDADPTAETETFESFAIANAEVAPPMPVRKVRTLHEPPEIWDLVPEAPKGFNRPAALFVRLTSINPLLLAVVVVLGGGGAVFGYMNWGNWSGLIRAASSFMDEPASKTSASLRATAPAKPPASSEQPRTDASRAVPNTKSTKAAVIAPEPKHPIAENAAALVVPTAEPVAAPAITSESSRVKPRRTNLTSAEPALTSLPGKRPSRLSSKPAAPSDELRRASSTAAKTAEEKTQTQAPVSQASAPARATATPKGKVIQWP